MRWIPAILVAALSSANADEHALGRKLYEEGLLADGSPVKATLLDGIGVGGGQFACANCHRRSGFGKSEGAVFTPPVVGPVLFAARAPKREDRFRKLFQEVQPVHARARVRDVAFRPAYDQASLAHALRTGTDPTGRQFHDLMPRYDLDDRHVRALAAYLKSLGATTPPGIEEDTIHFATVIAGGVSAVRRESLRNVLDAYVRRKNTDTRGKLAHPGFSPHFKDDYRGTFKEWRLHTWKLKGPPESWSAQLHALYRERPVFAILSGLGSPWEPVHQFCESSDLPCLFPQTPLPVIEGANTRTLYLSRGVFGEAESLAHQLAQKDPPYSHLVQIVGSDRESRALAKRLASRLPSSTKATTAPKGDPLPSSADAVALWLNSDEAAEIDLSGRRIASSRVVLVSSTLLGGRIPDFPKSVMQKLRIAWPKALPGTEPVRKFRAKAWMRSRRIPAGDEAVQLNTFFALTIADHALVHLVENYSREYFVESVEHEAENALNPGVFPHLSLGPGQRFASKGCYIVAPSESGAGIVPVTDWIVTSQPGIYKVPAKGDKEGK